ncbi:MAG: hypothetical protein K2G90_09435 [Muribaculaceae bacterium]|nr:hypothetical protein [Muribaculaceae bacterium]
MKKLFTAMAALALCSTAAFALDTNVVLPDTISFSPYEEDGEFLNSTEQVIHVTMDKVPSVPVTIMYITGNGFEMNMDYKRIDNPGSSFDIQLTTADWGVPFNEMYYLNLIVTFTYGEGEDIEYYLNEDEEPVAFQAMYITPDTGAPSLVKYAPNNDWNGVSFARAYEENEFKLFYTKEVKVEGELGTIQYYMGEELVDEISIPSYSKGWSDMDGLYVISFPYANEDFSADELSKIVINITGVSAGNKEIELDNSSVAPQKRIIKKGLEAELATSSEPTNVYSVQGTLVKKNATELSGLQPGLYIANGKKVVVK